VAAAASVLLLLLLLLLLLPLLLSPRARAWMLCAMKRNSALVLPGTHNQHLCRLGRACKSTRLAKNPELLLA